MSLLTGIIYLFVSLYVHAFITEPLFEDVSQVPLLFASDAGLTSNSKAEPKVDA